MYKFSCLKPNKVLFEGYETGIEHEWVVPFRANETYPGQKLNFQTDEFQLPSRPGWYTAKVIKLWSRRSFNASEGLVLICKKLMRKFPTDLIRLGLNGVTSFKSTKGFVLIAIRLAKVTLPSWRRILSATSTTKVARLNFQGSEHFHYSFKHTFRDEKRKLAYHFSFEFDEDDARSPSFKQFLQNRGTQPK